VAGAIEQRGDLRLQRRDALGQQARLDPLQQMLHCKKGVRLGVVEPQARQLVARAGLPALLFLEAVAALGPVPDDGGVQAAAQVFEIALQRGRGDFQFLLEDMERHHPPGLQQLVDAVEALGAVHSWPGSRGDGCGGGRLLARPSLSVQH
jgi:hypothetical protein